MNVVFVSETVEFSNFLKWTVSETPEYSSEIASLLLALDTLEVKFHSLCPHAIPSSRFRVLITADSLPPKMRPTYFMFVSNSNIQPVP